ncbi:hypothetical protein AnigIFM62618_010515 [Aspergillus niger]|nr:hypothetical protein AnigIFM62618_010515 [Aspergillus niger]
MASFADTKLVKNYHKCATKTLSIPRSGNALKTALMEGYNPSFRTVSMGKAADYATTLRPQQRICFYPGKLHGGIQAFYLDQIFADCCAGALTANLAMSYLRPVNPQAPLNISTWPVKGEGHKVYMEGQSGFRITPRGLWWRPSVLRPYALRLKIRPNEIGHSLVASHTLELM